MDSINIICPVCTLYLRPGITLKQHLTSHPKQKVIEALVKLSGIDDTSKSNGTSPQLSPVEANAAGQSVNNAWNQAPPAQMGLASQSGPPHGNHVFIYQQSMSTTSPQNAVLQVNPQQYVYPPNAFNPMMMMPYMYQQQHVILSSNALPPQIRSLEAPTTPQTEEQVESIEENVETESTIADVPESNEKIEDAEEETRSDNDLSNHDETVIKKQESLSDRPIEIKTMADFENERMIQNEIPPEGYLSEIEEDYEDIDNSSVIHDNCKQDETHMTEDIAPVPPPSITTWKEDTELSKACQTQTVNNAPQTVEAPTVMHTENHYVQEQEDHPEYFYVNSRNEEFIHQQQPVTYDDHHSTGSIPYTRMQNTEHYEQSDPIYTSANILHGGDHLDYVNLDDILIINDFNPNHVVAQVENFENASPERPGVLLTIGEYNEPRDFEESMSRCSSQVNIRSDERMPARGELSGPESMGGSTDLTWNRIHYQEGSSRMSHSYDLIGRDHWEGSDSDSVDNPGVMEKPKEQIEFTEHFNEDNDPVSIISCSGPPLNFKCPICGEDFATSKERKSHELEMHPEKTKCNIIGVDIGKKKVRKLVVKLKTHRTVTKVEAEPNFDNVFTNKLKQEQLVDPVVALEVPVKMDEPSLVVRDMKTICTICDCVCLNAKVLRQHKMEMHKNDSATRHKCSTCGEAFPNEYKYTDHLKVHPLECRLCGKLFFRRQNIRLHMKRVGLRARDLLNCQSKFSSRHLGLKPYKCDLCEKSFITRQKRDEHKNVHTGEAPLKCTMCDKKFRRHSNLVQHKNFHHFNVKKKVKDYICHCGEVFHSTKKLAWHKEIHETKPKACSQCNEKFLHLSSLTRHMRRAHNDKFLPQEKRKDENVECPICKGTYLKSSLDVHIKNHSGAKPYNCPLCNKDFTTKWNLKLHQWTHASRSSKPYKCEQCNAGFIRESDYIAHTNSHKSIRPYTCNYCGAQFIRKYNCLRHVKEHESDKTFSCTICGKTFHRSYYLKDHMRVHSGVRPHTCHICGKTSTTKSNHNKHVQIHHAREPVSTEN
ncbi:unnamed protein product [Phaedon cochleariae]|uniref:C2H2-type domain-containing protein n=1 Tax=Phaedon cochleariae TaxID=80249 RepID=A0A9P0DYA9_PHACE|nr:unnamed protein product [Phaedon cochleariae]